MVSAPLSEKDFANTLSNPGRLFIGGKWTKPAADGRHHLISPGSGRDFISVAMADAADVDLSVAAARAAFDTGPWPRMAPADRADYLNRLAEEISKRAQPLGGLQTAEMGVLYGMAVNSVPYFAQAFSFYAQMAKTFPFIERHPSSVGGEGFLVHEPVGVCAAIVPWNGPLMLACWKLAPALLSGCTVILKASPEAPASLMALAEAVAAVGFPPGVVNVITADRANSERLVRHPGVDKVSFTGSTETGKKIGAICAERVARCTLELGGKSPALLLDDYDVEAFAEQIAFSATLLTGQVCAALTRAIVPRSKQQRVLDAVAARFANIKVGDPFDSSVGMGPLASAAQCSRVKRYIESGRSEASLVFGGATPEGLDPRFYVAPTLFGDVTAHAQIAREEIFGPVLSVIPVDSEEQAIAIANDSDYGLNATVFTHDPARAFQVARQIRSGTVAQNGFKTDFTIAFGGYKQSGTGREGGVPGLRAYLEPKTVILDADPATSARP
ncbi:aldehyde dehydrogenase [Paraburkholderia sediminicola]|nr:aldehyde dehydrogenase [Paraburkholderia sediminicola]